MAVSGISGVAVLHLYSTSQLEIVAGIFQKIHAFKNNLSSQHQFKTKALSIYTLAYIHMTQCSIDRDQQAIAPPDSSILATVWPAIRALSGQPGH